ncbi:hypothetical protein [Streptomyces sp. ALI-76-A]|uniref:hypothetical protein n=1 Tax=Streptomyces sp. ALI-76-A TaxID=3025736 RepID=UPI00256F5B98|nr:hypothetical protein [Streptomyces sp. ALI-76-A]MDL5205324.1 hypothetical protein [Streptomyces sp. ALI-76-A]
MILLVLLMPALMMAFIFAMDALEDHLFPRPRATDDGKLQPPTHKRDPPDSARPTDAAGLEGMPRVLLMAADAPGVNE